MVDKLFYCHRPLLIKSFKAMFFGYIQAVGGKRVSIVLQVVGTFSSIQCLLKGPQWLGPEKFSN